MRVDFSPPDITDAECQEVVDALRSGWITTGPRTHAQESTSSEEGSHRKPFVGANTE